MKILVHGINYAPEKIGIAVYTTGLAEELVRRGHQVSIVSAKPYYPLWKKDPGFRRGVWRRSMENGVDVTRVAIYVPTHPSGRRRILHHLTFAISGAIPLVARALFNTPDVVLVVAPSLIGSPVAFIAAKISGARSWMHIQDFEVEAAVAVGLVNQRGYLNRLGRWFERAMLNSFDRVSSISTAMCTKAVEKGVKPDRIFEFRNWADLTNVIPQDTPSFYRAEWRITTPHVALYSGNIANKQGIEIVLEIAYILRHRSDVTFIVCGNGPNRDSLQSAAKGLENIRFYDLQPVERLGELLSLATVHLLIQRAEAADLVLPSKLTNILASGRPVVATAPTDTALASEVEGCGLVVPPGNAEAFAAAIENLVDDDDLRRRLGVASRERALARWDKQSIISSVEQEIRALVTLPTQNRNASNSSRRID